MPQQVLAGSELSKEEIVSRAVRYLESRKETGLRLSRVWQRRMLGGNQRVAEDFFRRWDEVGIIPETPELIAAKEETQKYTTFTVAKLRLVYGDNTVCELCVRLRFGKPISLYLEQSRQKAA